MALPGKCDDGLIAMSQCLPGETFGAGGCQQLLIELRKRIRDVLFTQISQGSHERAGRVDLAVCAQQAIRCHHAGRGWHDDTPGPDRFGGRHAM